MNHVPTKCGEARDDANRERASKVDRLAGSTCSGNRTCRPETQASLALIAELNAARARLDASTALLNHALDVRELLWGGLDLDDITDMLTRSERDIRAHVRAGES